MARREEILDVATKALQALLAHEKNADRIIAGDQPDMDEFVLLSVWIGVDLVNAVNKHVLENPEE